MMSRKKLFTLLESYKQNDSSTLWFDRFIIVLILLNTLAVILETLPDPQQIMSPWFYYFEIFSIGIFTVEYFCRLWVCVEDESEKFIHPIRGRLKYMFSPMALVDLIAILPFYLTLFVGIDLRFIRLFRLLRILKMWRYLPIINTLVTVFQREKQALLASFGLLLTLLLFVSSVIYIFEHQQQPDVFGSIPSAMWWSMATLTTVGYGDVVPITPLGKIFGMLVMLLGIAMFALPAGILASGFSEEINRKHFIAQWDMVAQVPFFSYLNAIEIAEIAGLLKPERHIPKEVIFHQGDVGDCMYFIINGELTIEQDPEPITLKRGHFFGEIALLYDIKRVATVRATTYTELLKLDIKDFHIVLNTNPQLKQHMIREAKNRYNIELDNL
jgi:voltage-gated potassium channel